MCNGPTAGLKLFAKLDKFRVLVAGGDGSVGWVLTEMDKLNLHHKAVVGVLPLGTGNDLSQVLGWGTVCSNDSNVPQIINYVERATTKMLDRWSVLTYDGPPIVSGSDMPTNDEAELNNYLKPILDNQNPEKVHKAVDGLYELSKKVQTSRLSKFLDLIQKAGWTNNADVNQQTRNQVIDRANSIKKLLRAAVQSENSPRKSPIASPKPRISPNLTDSSGNSGSGATPKISPFRYVTEDLYDEKYVMNNYFGIGVDAKIVLEFHKKRDASPKSASRLKNMMRFGLLSGAEMLSQTYKDLHKRIEVECDGEVVRLPALQGIVIMNIPSYSGGMNFWGNTDNHETFVTPSFNDKMFEVMAVFGTTHLALSMAEKATRVNAISSHAMQCHRIAQCSSVRVTILEGDPLPIQVDGEAWLQRPGVIQIKHKNRVHMLAKAKQGNPARDEVIDLTDEEIELLSKQFLLLHSFCSRPKEKSSKQIDDLMISLQDYEKHKLDPNIVLTRSNFFAVFQHVELVRQNTLTEDNEIIFRIDQVLAEIAKEMPWSLNQPQNQKPTNPKVSKTTIKQQISKLNERLEKLGLPGDVSLWTNQNVSTWLKEVVRVEHETLKIFIDHDIKGKDVLGLDRHDLRRTMQIREDDKKKFMAERELLRKLQKDRKS
jgi:diacylglycerol kinase family enzyme